MWPCRYSAILYESSKRRWIIAYDCAWTPMSVHESLDRHRWLCMSTCQWLLPMTVCKHTTANHHIKLYDCALAHANELPSMIVKGHVSVNRHHWLCMSTRQWITINGCAWAHVGETPSMSVLAHNTRVTVIEFELGGQIWPVLCRDTVNKTCESETKSTTKLHCSLTWVQWSVNHCWWLCMSTCQWTIGNRPTSFEQRGSYN